MGATDTIFLKAQSLKRDDLFLLVYYPSLRRHLIMNKHLLASWSVALICRLNLQLPWMVSPNSEILLY